MELCYIQNCQKINDLKAMFFAIEINIAFFKNFFKKVLTLKVKSIIIIKSLMAAHKNGSLAQLGEHLPYKQRVIGSSPIAPIIYGRVVQLVRMPACHAGGRGFEPLLGRICLCSSVGRAGD